jgi:hypothetical protein
VCVVHICSLHQLGAHGGVTGTLRSLRILYARALAVMPPPMAAAVAHPHPHRRLPAGLQGRWWIWSGD